MSPLQAKKRELKSWLERKLERELERELKRERVKGNLKRDFKKHLGEEEEPCRRKFIYARQHGKKMIDTYKFSKPRV